MRFTSVHRYGTVIRAMPAAKLPIPPLNVRIVVGYWSAVNVGINAFTAPMDPLTINIKDVEYFN